MSVIKRESRAAWPAMEFSWPDERIDRAFRDMFRDFFAGHFGITDTVFINAELANSRQDPSLAHLRDEHDRSHALALETARRLAKGY